MNDHERGLYGKYEVYNKRPPYRVLEPCFILKFNDPHSLMAAAVDPYFVAGEVGKYKVISIRVWQPILAAVMFFHSAKARTVLMAYSRSCRADFPQLASDIQAACGNAEMGDTVVIPGFKP